MVGKVYFSDMDKSVEKTKAQIQRERALSLLESADKLNLPSSADVVSNPADGEESFRALYEESLKKSDFKVGDVVKGRVISIENDHVLVDINYKSEGFIPKSEFRLVAGKGNIEVGQELDVYIDRIENEDGMMALSKDRADIIKIWKDISKVVDNEEVIEGTVIAKVKGGLSVDIGVKAFLPGSQIDLRPVRDLNVYIGKKFQFKVIKFNQKRGNIVLSRRVLLSQERKNLRTRILSEIKEGAVIKGVVKNITDYGVFLDLGGLDGLLHITDMSWNRIKHPSELVALGDEVEIKVLKFDQEKNRVSLGMKQLTADPWGVVGSEVKIGDVLKACVVSLTEYGAFMRIREGVEGLVHVSEMSWGKKVKHPSQLLKVNDEVNVKVLGVDQEHHRISLGIKQLEKNPWVDLKEKYPVGTKLETTVKSITDFGLFVEIKGEEVDGLIHVSDLSWTEHIAPKEKYKKGDVVTALVREINTDEGRFSLSVKHLKGDPWTNVEAKYPPGSRHEVKVKKLMDFGVFVELEPGVEGLIHVSELSVKRVEKVDQIVKVGDLLKVEVLNIDLEAQKIGLSVKQVQLRGGGDSSSAEGGEQRERATSSTTDEGAEQADKAQAEESGASAVKSATVSADMSAPSDPHPSDAEKKKKPESFFGRALKASLGVKSEEQAVAEKERSEEKSEEKSEEESEEESEKTPADKKPGDKSEKALADKSEKSPAEESSADKRPADKKPEEQ